jgi:MFS superfamily sulfate permease-like transporter
MENKYCWYSSTWVKKNFESKKQNHSKYYFSIPPPVAPPMAAISDVIGDAIAIAIVCFVVNISMAKLFATKYKYQISPNQELFAYSIGNIVTAFFHGFPACVALSRCAVVESTGGKTQVK